MTLSDIFGGGKDAARLGLDTWDTADARPLHTIGYIGSIQHSLIPFDARTVNGPDFPWISNLGSPH